MRTRIAVLTGLAAVLASIIVAIAIDRTLTYCSYLGGQPPPPCSRPTDYSLGLRLGIVAAGLVAAALIIWVGGGVRLRSRPTSD